MGVRAATDKKKQVVQETVVQDFVQTYCLDFCEGYVFVVGWVL